LKLTQILKAPNLVILLDEQQKTDIKQQVLDRYRDDLNSRHQKQEQLADIVKLALQVSQEKSTPWDNCSNVIFPITSTAALEFAARCYPEMIKDNNSVKAKVIGKDDGEPVITVSGEEMTDESGQIVLQNIGAKLKRGKRVAIFMNWQLFEQMPEWQQDTDTLLTAVAVTGTMFRKIFNNPVTNSPDSQLIFPDKLILNDKARSLEKAPVTHIIELYEQEIIERIRKEIFIEFDFDNDSGDVNTAPKLDIENQASNTYANTGIHVFLEQHNFFDLDNDGYPEPYITTIHEQTGTIVRMVPRFTEEDITYNSKNQISAIKAKHFFQRYIFFPSADGSFYGVGLGHLLFNINMSIDSCINQLIDSATLSNLGGGFLAKNMKIIGGETKFRPGEWKFADSFGSDLKDNIVPLPVPEPSSTLFTLLSFLTEAGKDLGLLRDVLMGDGPQNIAATTQLSQVEQGLKQFRAIYKRIYVAFKGELKKIFELNKEYVTNEEYARVLDEKLIDVDVKQDFNSDEFDIVPVADIDAITDVQRRNTATFLMQFLNDPYFQGLELRKRILEGYGIEEVDKLITQPQPQPDPLVQMEMVKQQNKARELEIEATKVAGVLEDSKYKVQEILANVELKRSEAIKNIAEAEAKEKGHQLAEYESGLDAIHRQIEAEMKLREQEFAEKQHQDQMEQQQLQQQQQEQMQGGPAAVNSQITD